jgi:peptide/nickel transport system permease protein
MADVRFSVNTEPVEQMVPEVEHSKLSTASQWQLMWWRFCRHRAAFVSFFFICFLYAATLFSQFLAPYEPLTKFANYRLAPPQRIYWIEPQTRRFGPFVYPLTTALDMQTFERTFTEDRTRPTRIRFFVRGDAYRFLGLWRTNLHLFGTTDATVPVYLWGGDDLGRDLFSNVLAGARISLSIGLLGIAISFFLGVSIGGIAGYYGGWIDNLIQRSIEFINSIPGLPLWMALSAALPPNWPPLAMYFGITVILSLIGWTGLARVVRGKFLMLRTADFVVAAEISGQRQSKIIFGHMLPSFMSHIIASISLSIPGMILGETTLSFLGLGLKRPTVSWGVLLGEAQSLTVLSSAPWLLLPALVLILTVLAFNFMGDGLRDAADPYMG